MHEDLISDTQDTLDFGALLDLELSRSPEPYKVPFDL